jgi:peptide/nickel transport system permease protein
LTNTTSTAATGLFLSLQRFIKPVLNLMLTLVLTFVGLTAVTFTIGRVMPADPVLAVIGDRAPQSAYDRVYLEMGLDRPIYEQYGRYLNELAHGEL